MKKKLPTKISLFSNSEGLAFDNTTVEPSSSDPLLVSQQRNYRVLTTDDAKQIASEELMALGLESSIEFGLPEIDDRYHIWRVPLVRIAPKQEKVGEIVIDARTSLIQKNRSTKETVLRERLNSNSVNKKDNRSQNRNPQPSVLAPYLRNMIICGDSEKALIDLPAESLQLAFTSPPYYNARPDYTDYVSYKEYLLKIRKVIQQVHRVLEEGRFFVMNVAPVLIRRSNRSQASRRIAVPFDIHQLFIEEGFDFIDDIIWEKPEGAGWATSRGRRFAADRNPLQYKAVPVTEYILVYRKQSDRLIDWHIRNHDKDIVQRSKIPDGYEKTNIWRIPPTSSKLHPAVFPITLAQKVIQYYSFEGDAVLDPFAGIGTVGEAAVALKRRFVLIEQDAEYINIIRKSAVKWLQNESANVLCVDCSPINPKE